MKRWLKMSNNEIIPQYDVIRQDYTSEEKAILAEIRENLVDRAMNTNDNFQVSEDNLLKEIKNFLSTKKNIPQDYQDTLSQKLVRDITGYGEIDSLIQDDDLEEIMIIGIDKPVFVYHRKYGMMKTNIKFFDCKTNQPTHRPGIPNTGRQTDGRFKNQCHHPPSFSRRTITYNT